MDAEPHQGDEDDEARVVEHELVESHLVEELRLGDREVELVVQRRREEDADRAEHGADVDAIQFPKQATKHGELLSCGG